MRIHPRCNQGLTLAEVLIALAILMIALIPMIACIQGSMGTTKDSDEVIRATNLARLVIEEAKNTPYDKVTEKSRSSFSSTRDPLQRYTYTLSVTQYPSPGADPSYKQIEVKIYIGNSTAPVVSLTTCLVNEGV